MSGETATVNNWTHLSMCIKCSLVISSDFWYDRSEKEKTMTTEMIHEIMQEMFDNDKSGGLDYIESDKVNKIIWLLLDMSINCPS